MQARTTFALPSFAIRLTFFLVLREAAFLESEALVAKHPQSKDICMGYGKVLFYFTVKKWKSSVISSIFFFLSLWTRSSKQWLKSIIFKLKYISNKNVKNPKYSPNSQFLPQTLTSEIKSETILGVFEFAQYYFSRFDVIGFS